MASPIPLSPSFASLSTTPIDSSNNSDELLPTPKVRFDHECVLIPDPTPVSRLPRLVTKSYSLPLWKRKRELSVDSEPEVPDDHVVFKVSVPSISIKARSPSRDSHRPLVSCLIHHDPSTTPPSPQSRPAGRPRRASLPAPPISADVVTVPLRACCSQCYPSIDECMKEGEHYQVHFSRGALRRRKSVSDARTPSRSRYCVRDATPGFETIVAVDEVDHRRRSQDMDVLTAFTLALPSTCVGTDDEPEEIPLRRALSLPDAIHPRRAKFLQEIHPAALSPPIQEEDEFRPSPRRTPIPSPFASSTNLRAMHAVAVEAAPAPVLKTHIDPAAAPDSILPAGTLRGSPGPLTPPSASSEDSSYFGTAHKGAHERAYTDSPCTSPTSSPEIGFARPSVLDSPTGTRRRPAFGSIIRASTSVLKGITSMGTGMPMSA